MGSNAINIEDEDLCCPVCKKPLSSPGKPPKPKLNKFGKSRAPNYYNAIQAQRDTRMAIGKLKDNEDVVVAQCGHLFHKFCLRHYCYLFREGRPNHMCKISCPWCDRRISMSFQIIDYRAHQDRVVDRDKDLTKTSIMNNELAGQMKSVQKKFQNVKDAIEEGNHNFELYRTHWRKLRKELKYVKSKRLEIENMYSEIERSEKMLKCMQSQQLKIVKKFVAKVKEKEPKDFIHFPRRLAPYLHIIEGDDRLVRDLGEIIVPIHLNHLKSDRQSLLKGIIAAVHERLKAEGKSIEPTTATSTTSPRAKQQVKVCEELKKPAFYVKVRKSSISILSSTTLTRESIQQIIQTINLPFHGSKKRSESASSKKNGKTGENTSNHLVENVSASDIKILYMPKRKVIEQASEPCRTRNESESFVEIPTRKCRSTDAVLVKTKKKKGKLSASGKDNKSPEKSTLKEKRSSTAAVIATKLENAHEDFIPTNNETCPTTIEVPEQEILVPPVSDEPIEVHEEAKEADEQDDSINLDENNVAITENPESNLSPQITQNSDSVPDLPSQVPAPIETASMLKLIYDNLEEEHKSTHALEVESCKSEWTEVDENNNEQPRSIISRKPVFPTANSTVSSESQPAPKFFRVDRRGVARPESPQLTQLRQPTLLQNTEEDANPCNKSLITSGFQPDEENQLHALSPDDKILILSEHEAYLSSKPNCADSVRRPMFHGSPACLGLPDKQFHFSTPPPPCNVPFYLKKWQQQLASRKILKAVPKRFANNNTPLQSTRLLNSPKETCDSRFSAMHSYPQAASQYQKQTEKESFSPSGRGIHLPPLFMYPANRPATAQCDNILESYSSSNIMDHVHGPDLQIPRIYNGEFFWN